MAVSLRDLGTVLEETFAARSKWYYIGLKLGVEVSELDAIKIDNAEAVKDCYLEMLKCWLKGVAPEPTWAALAEALASDMVDEGGLAEKLKSRYCPDARGSYSKGLAKGDPKRMDGATASAKSTLAVSFSYYPTTPTSVTDAGYPYFEFDLDKVSPMFWDARLEEDLFRGVDPSQLAHHRNLCHSVFGCCITEFGRMIHFREIIPYMASRNMLTEDEVYQLTDMPISKSEKVYRLTTNILPLKRSVLTPISLFYSCLVESAATEDGLEDHYYLAQRLRESVYENIHRKWGVLEETRKREIQETDVLQLTKKVCQKFPPVDDTTIRALIHQLKLPSSILPVTAKHSIARIFDVWSTLYLECDWTEVVEALVLVPRLGYLVSDLLSPCRSGPPQMCRFVYSLEDDWSSLAEYLGYPRRLVRAIQNHWAGSYHSQIKAFLKYWVFPDCGMTNNLRIVERLKMCLEKDSEADSRQAATLGKVQSRLHGELRDLLKQLQTFEDKVKAGVIQEAICKHASTCLSLGASIDHVTDQLQRLCRDELHISEGLYRQALQDTIDFHAELHLALTGAAVASKPTTSKPQPLFNKDTVYHAGICSLAVCTSDAGNYQQLFKDKELVPGHSLTGVSLSRSKHDRYLIARQGDSTVYLGFQGEPLLLEWSKQFKSFGKGITTQSEKFPIRFIIDLLNKQQRIVLTGFSFGGLLAAALMARVWETPYFPVALLKQNLVCITFGQPHVTVPMLESAAAQNPELASCIHSFYCEDDPVPRLLRVLDKSWSLELSHKGRERHLVLLMDPFDDPVTRKLLDDIMKLQQMISKDDGYLDLLTEAISRIKRVLEKLDPSRSGAGRMVSSTFHLIATHPRTGLTCYRLSQDQAALQCGFLTPDDLEALVTGAMNLFKQHSSLVYIQTKLYCGFLEKQPNYTFPSAPKFVPPVVPNLKPTIEAVKLRHHVDRTSVAVEGENFWFCYNLTVNHLSRRLPPQEITGSSIQFDVPHHKTSTATEGGRVSVSLQSHFFKTVNQKVQVDEKRYDISTRQQQLAQLTPSQLMELAYLCALLEQHPCGKSEPLSHKLEVIKSFLERVVHVVPLESVAFAVGSGSDETIEMCSQALMDLHSQLTIPASNLFAQGLSFALQRLRTGVPVSVLRKMDVKAYEQLSVPLPAFGAISCEMDSDTISVSCRPRAPGGHSDPFSKPLSVVKRKLDAYELKSRHILKETTTAFLDKLLDRMRSEVDQGRLQGIVPLICGLNIEELYPTGHDSQQQQHCPALNSPLDTLVHGRKKLGDLRVVTASHQASKLPSPEQVIDRQKGNQLMLQSVNDIRKREVATCATLLGAFMEQEDIFIGLSKSNKDHVSLGLSASASVGVWALFSLDYSQVKSILAQCKGEQVLVKIGDFVKATLGNEDVPDDSQYAAKLQFIAQGITKTVTCNSQYVSYSLEQQLADMCKQANIVSVDNLLMRWSRLFKDNVLSLVCYQYRPLIARWLKWALMIHELRQELAKYTAIGVVGLLNSGKSKLVNTIFGIKIPVGTAEASRTTVPFLYNLDEHVKGLDVVDFPGVDDEDDTIPDLADLLVTVTQIVIFVVDYRRVGSQSAKQWLDRLQREKVPVLVCLTFADKFYAEYMSEDGQHPTKAEMEFRLHDQLTETRKKLGSCSSHEVQFFSFSQDRDSVLNSPDGRRRLEEVGIGSPLDVGAWLVRVFREDFGQESLANQLESFTASPHTD